MKRVRAGVKTKNGPRCVQLDELNLALQLYSEKAAAHWQDSVYRRCQQLSMQEGALTHLIRNSIKAAHFFELTHAWCAPFHRLQVAVSLAV